MKDLRYKNYCAKIVFPTGNSRIYTIFIRQKGTVLSSAKITVLSKNPTMCIASYNLNTDNSANQFLIKLTEYILAKNNIKKMTGSVRSLVEKEYLSNLHYLFNDDNFWDFSFSRYLDLQKAQKAIDNMDFSSDQAEQINTSI